MNVIWLLFMLLTTYGELSLYHLFCLPTVQPFFVFFCFIFFFPLTIDRHLYTNTTCSCNSARKTWPLLDSSGSAHFWDDTMGDLTFSLASLFFINRLSLFKTLFFPLIIELFFFVCSILFSLSFLYTSRILLFHWI